MATLLAATTRHYRTESFSGILTNQYLLHPYPLRGRGVDWAKRVLKEHCRQLSAKQMVKL